MSQPETGRKYPPASTCIFCDKSLDEVGGQRLTAHWSLAVFPSSKPIGGGNPKAPNRPLRISSDPPVYLILRGLSSRWTPEHIAKAKALFLEGKRPWFCQVCGNRCCHECGTPIAAPLGPTCCTAMAQHHMWQSWALMSAAQIRRAANTESSIKVSDCVEPQRRRTN